MNSVYSGRESSRLTLGNIMKPGSASFRSDPPVPAVRRRVVWVLLGLGLVTLALRPQVATCLTNPVVANNADSGAGSLRQAILDASDGSTITFANTVASPITLTSELAIDKNLTIAGPGAGVLTISGNNAVRVFSIGNVTPAINVTLSGLTIGGGKATDTGGGISNNSTGTVNVINSMVSGNTVSALIFPAGGGISNNSTGTVNVINSMVSGNTVIASCCIPEGGGISNNSTGTVNVIDSTISANTISGNEAQGAGLFNNSTGTVNVTNSAVTGNSALGNTPGEDSNASGGGIYNLRSGTVNVTNSTITGNTAIGLVEAGTGFGGGIFNDTPGTLNVTSSTITGNTATAMDLQGSGQGGGIYNSGRANVKSSIVALNFAPVAPDLIGSYTSQGHNLVGNPNNSSGFANGVNNDQVGSIAPLDPKLGPLQNNGGPTFTMALLTGSPAIDAGDDGVLGAPLFLTTDQRGAGFPRKSGSHVDIGAFELQQCTAPMVTLNPVSQVGTGGGVMFMASASGTPTPIVQWQVSADGGATFTNIPGATSTTLSFTPTPSQSGSQYRAVFTNGCGAATTAAATLTVLNVCLKDNNTGNLLQWNSTTGQYTFTRCADGFMITGTGVVKLVNGIQALTDFKSNIRLSAGLNPGQLTGNATIYLQVAQGVWQSFQIVDTNPNAVCTCVVPM